MVTSCVSSLPSSGGFNGSEQQFLPGFVAAKKETNWFQIQCNFKIDRNELRFQCWNLSDPAAVQGEISKARVYVMVATKSLRVWIQNRTVCRQG